MKLIEITGFEPCTLADVKEYLGIDHTEQDDLITSLIIASREYIEKQTNTSLVTTEWQISLTCFPSVVKLAKSPFVSLESFTYTNSAGSETTVDSSVYIVDDSTAPARIRLAYNQSWPTNRDWYNSIKVNFIAGYSTDEYGANWTGPDELLILLKELVYGKYHYPDWDFAMVKDIPRAKDVLAHYNLESYLI